MYDVKFGDVLLRDDPFVVNLVQSVFCEISIIPSNYMTELIDADRRKCGLSTIEDEDSLWYKAIITLTKRNENTVCISNIRYETNDTTQHSTGTIVLTESEQKQLLEKLNILCIDEHGKMLKDLF